MISSAYFSRRAAAASAAMMVLLLTACTAPAPQTLTLQCITGSDVWTPITLDTVHPVVGGYPATITDRQIEWNSITRNGFGGATHTRYLLDRGTGRIAVDSIYVDPRGNRTAEPGNYAGECHVRHRSF